jgi:hypothetical protein
MCVPVFSTTITICEQLYNTILYPSGTAKLLPTPYDVPRCPSVLRKLRGHTQRNAHHTKKHDVRKIPAQDIMRQGECK